LTKNIFQATAYYGVTMAGVTVCNEAFYQ